MKSIFELAENLSLVLTKLDNEIGIAQPQLVFSPFFLFLGAKPSLEITYFTHTLTH